MSSFKPMLSGKAPADLSKLSYPLIVSPKLDGIRCVMRNGVAVSRNLKPIPNRFIQSCMSKLPDGLDGELIVGKPNDKATWNATQSGVMSEDGEPEFTFWVFDMVTDKTHGDRFIHRLRDADRAIDGYSFCKLVRHVLVHDSDKLSSLEDSYVQMGFEGVMVRSPEGPYKYGRSTEREGWLLKVKRWEDAEAFVVGVVERMHNSNEATKDELGRTKRSSAKGGKIGRGDLGALVCNFDGGVRFELGTGFNDLQRRMIWDAHSEGHVIGRLVKFKYQALTPDGVPRFPVYQGFRDARDT